MVRRTGAGLQVLGWCQTPKQRGSKTNLRFAPFSVSSPFIYRVGIQP